MSMKLLVSEAAPYLCITTAALRNMINAGKIDRSIITMNKLPASILDPADVLVVADKRIAALEAKLSAMRAGRDGLRKLVVSPTGDKLVSPTSSLRLGNGSVVCDSTESPEL